MDSAEYQVPQYVGEYMAATGGAVQGGPPSRQSSGSVEGGQPMVPLGYVPAMVPVYGMPSGGLQQAVDSVPTGGATGGLGYEFLPELHSGQASVEVAVATVGAPGHSPTAFACSTPFPDEVETVVGECEPVAPTNHQPETNAYGAYAPPAGYTLVPVGCSMQMAQHLQQLPTVSQQLPQQASFFAPAQFQPAPLASPSAAVWSAPICHVSTDLAVAGGDYGRHATKISSFPGKTGGASRPGNVS